jgi:hypothetical protein
VLLPTNLSVSSVTGDATPFYVVAGKEQSWTITATSQSDWLQLAQDANGSNASTGVSGTGSMTIYAYVTDGDLAAMQNTGATISLTSGGVSTINVTATMKWALSNVYKDTESGKLTFEVTNSDPTVAQYQGLFFKYGSLIGIRPYIGWTVSFKPSEYMGATTPWGVIPYDDTSAVLTDFNAAAGTGDVCRYISAQVGWAHGSWRMPTYAEGLQLIMTASYQGTATAFTPPTTDDNTNGKYKVANNGYQLGAAGAQQYYPLSGDRTNSSAIEYLGTRGYYWLSNGGTIALNPTAGASVTARSDTALEYARPIRCVKASDPYIRIVPQDYEFIHHHVDPSYSANNADIRRDSWLVDGQAKVLRVKSNVEWRIASITERVYSLQGQQQGESLIADWGGLVVGATGGPSSAGVDITITPITDKTRWGDLSIVFEDPAGQAPPVTQNIILALPEMRVKGLGASGGWTQYNPVFHPANNAEYNKYGGYAMFSTEENYGTKFGVSKVYCRGFLFGGRNAGGNYDLTPYTNVDDTDILIITYSCYASQSQDPAVLRQFLDDGGVLLFFMEHNDDDTNRNNLFRTIFNDQNLIRTQSDKADQLFVVRDIPTDPVVNGVFGNMGGKYWGSDVANTTQALTLSTISSDIIVYSLDATGSAVLACRSQSRPLIFCGDGGFWCTNSSRTLTGGTAWPFKIAYNDEGYYNGQPMPRPEYAAAAIDVYNSLFGANMMAWAITQALNSDGDEQ